jgi:hypothetical protein
LTFSTSMGLSSKLTFFDTRQAALSNRQNFCCHAQAIITP